MRSWSRPSSRAPHTTKAATTAIPMTQKVVTTIPKTVMPDTSVSVVDESGYVVTNAVSPGKAPAATE